jgi:superfamily II DNA or RNA helicase
MSLFELTSPRPPRPWQLEALREWAKHDHRGVIEAVTGAGKTMVGVHAIARVLGLGGQALVLVPTVDLANQWLEVVLAELGPGARPGLRAEGEQANTSSHQLVISTVQSMFRRPLAPVLPFNVLVADEVHRLGADQFGQALHPGWDWRLGLTGTWERPDGAHELVLAPYFGGVVFSLGYRQAHSAGSIAPFDVHMVGVRLDEEGLESYQVLTGQMEHARNQLRGMGALRGAGTTTGKIAGLTHRGGVISKVAFGFMGAYARRNRLLGTTRAKLDALGRLAPVIQGSQRTLVFAQTIDAVKDATRTLAGHDVDVASLWGGMSKKDQRKKLLRGFAEGKPQCLCTPKILDEGIDVPAADVGIVMAASGSQRQMIQRMGRVIRPKDDGHRALFFILYCIDTIEDPAKRAHRDFLAQVRASGSPVYNHRMGGGQDWEQLLGQLASGRPGAPMEQPAAGLQDDSGEDELVDDLQ